MGAKKYLGCKDWEELAVFFGDTATDERTLFSDPLILCLAVLGERRVFVWVCAGVKFLLIYTN